MVLTREHVTKTLKKHGYAVPGRKRVDGIIAASWENPDLPNASPHWLNDALKIRVFGHAAKYGADPVREALKAGFHPADPGFASAAKRNKLAAEARAAKAREGG